MSWRARGKTKIANSANNTGTGNVISGQSGMGRGRVLRSIIAMRAPCKNKNANFDCLTIRTYNTRTANAGSNARINNRL